MKTVVLGITASIAAYKSLELIRALVKHDIKVIPVVTPEANHFVTPLSLESLAGHKTFCDFFAESESVLHIEIMNEATCIAIVPATANFIGKLANGIVDNLLLGITFAADKPVLIAPAMNTRMWNNPILKENVRKLKDLGYHFSGPGSGALACKEEGPGRLEDLDVILEEILALTEEKQSLTGKKVLVTLGRTKEYLDPIRFLSNDSSGRFGLEMAKAARRSGAHVTIVAGYTDVPIPSLFRTVRVTNTESMKKETLSLLKTMDVVIMNAACSDFTPATREKEKIKKGKGKITVPFERTPDILSHIKEKKKKQLIVGFSLDTRDARASAKKKMKEKGVDIMVANTAPSIGGDHVEMLIITKKESKQSFERMSKQKAAAMIIDIIASSL
jgi:phosphopantothenoylcysteine decarboxylase/phosphopantothenate--cysteine ligase